MSLTVMIKATANANCPRRALVLRSVLRRSCPKLDSHELVRSMVHRIPSVLRLSSTRRSCRELNQLWQALGLI